MLPAKIRKVIYILTAIASPVIAYLGQQGRLDSFWTGLFAVIVTAVTALATVNVTDTKYEL